MRGFFRTVDVKTTLKVKTSKRAQSSSHFF